MHLNTEAQPVAPTHLPKWSFMLGVGERAVTSTCFQGAREGFKVIGSLLLSSFTS